MNNEEFEMLGEPRMTMAQFWIEEQLAEQEELTDQEIIDKWLERAIPGDPPPFIQGAFDRENVRLLTDTLDHFKDCETWYGGECDCSLRFIGMEE